MTLSPRRHGAGNTVSATRALLIPVMAIRAATALFLVASLGTAITMPAQQASRRNPSPASPPKAYRIAGKMIDSVTGEALSGATLTLRAGEPRETIQTALSDADGHFELEPVPAAKYSLSASRRGYISAAFDEHDLYSSAIVTGEGQDTSHIQFRLNPGATIRGIVTDDAGEPVPNADVMIMLRTKYGGMGEHLVKSISGDTDDNGLFEFWNLLPGTYLMAVRANPWFAVHSFSTEQDQAASEEEREEMAVLDVAYPITFYPGTTDEAAASAIPVASGERMQADISLHAVPAVHLTVHPAGPRSPESDFFPRPALGQTIFGNQNLPSFAQSRPGPPGSGSIEFTGLAPGHYTVTQGDPPRVSEIDASGGQEVDLAAGAPVFGVDLKVLMADGSVPPQPLNMTLYSDDGLMREITAQAGEKSVAHFDAVPPGRWTLFALSKNLWLGVISLQSRGQSTADTRIVVKDRSLSFTAVVAQGKSSIEGFAKKNGEGEPGVMVVLVPKDPAASLEFFRRDQSDSDGSFSLRYAAPGEYTIVAIENGWDLDWARPEVISRYLRQGIQVTVTLHSAESIKLAAPVLVQLR